MMTTDTPRETMRDRFYRTAAELLDEDERVAVVVAEIGKTQLTDLGVFERHPDRALNVGIREQLMISVGAGMALEGMRPILHSYAPFLVERAFEQVKLDFSHQEVDGVLVSIGASYDAASEGRTHQSPADVAAIATMPGCTIYVPGHRDEVEATIRAAVGRDERAYIRLAEQTNAVPYAGARRELFACEPVPRVRRRSLRWGRCLIVYSRRWRMKTRLSSIPHVRDRSTRSPSEV